jgi:hypothetical protein
MAIYVPGVECGICHRPVTNAGEAIGFPPFVANEADPLWMFSDALLHKDCFLNHPLGSRASARLKEVQESAVQSRLLCVVCGERISNPDSLVPLGHLTGDSAHPLWRFNYSHLHRACISKWLDRELVVRELQSMLAKGDWRGKGLDWLLGAFSEKTR